MTSMQTAHSGYALRRVMVLAVVLASLTAGWAAVAPSAHFPSLASAASGNLSSARAALAHVPLAFEENRGQAAPNVRFLVRAHGYTLSLTPNGAILSIARPLAHGSMLRGRMNEETRHPAIRSGSRPDTVHLTFRGAAAQPRIVGMVPLAGRVNYLLGNNPKRWHTDIPTYAAVEYRSIYPGIDLRFHSRGGQIELDWIVGPHADPNRISMVVQGGRWIRQDARGAIVVQTANGVLRQEVPRLYQAIGGHRVSVAGRYVLRTGGRIGLQIGRYDANAPLIIDPVLVYGTYLGGGQAGDTGTVVTGVALDSASDTYVAGYEDFQNGNNHMFVLKLSADGSKLLYVTFIGGSNTDQANGIAVDGTNHAYVVGYTNSNDFPALPSVGNAGGTSATVTKVSASGDGLVYSTRSNATGTAWDTGTNYTIGWSIVLLGGVSVTGPTADAYICGFKRDASGKDSPFVTRLNTDGSLENYNATFGGSGKTWALGIALDSSDGIYVVGWTQSTNLPTKNAYQSTSGGGQDGFLAEFSYSLTALAETYIGGRGDDEANRVAVDPQAGIYITGDTTSPDFPTSPPGAPFAKTDGWVLKLSDTMTLVYSFYLGGNGDDYGESIAVNAAGEAYVAGNTTSTDFPTRSPLQAGLLGTQDAFVAKVSADGHSLLYSTYLGGNGVESGYDVVTDGAGRAYVVGSTTSAYTAASTGFPITSDAFQDFYFGGVTGFLAVIADSAPPPPATPTTTPTSTPTVTSTPSQTNTPTVTPTSTSVPATATGTTPPTSTATLTATAVPTPTSTSVPAATATATRVPVTATPTPVPPPPDTPDIALKSSKVNAGSKLKISIVTSPGATVTITLQVTQKKKVLYSSTAQGQADSTGTFTKTIKIKFHPSKATKALITVKVQSAGGTSVNSTHFTIEPHP